MCFCFIQFIGQTGLVVHADGGKTILVSYSSNFYNISVAAVTKVLIYGSADSVETQVPPLCYFCCGYLLIFMWKCKKQSL